MAQLTQDNWYEFEGGHFDGQTIKVQMDLEVVRMDEPMETPAVARYDMQVPCDLIVKVIEYRKTARCTAGGTDWWYVYVLI